MIFIMIFWVGMLVNGKIGIYATTTLKTYDTGSIQSFPLEPKFI